MATMRIKVRTADVLTKLTKVLADKTAELKEFDSCVKKNAAEVKAWEKKAIAAAKKQFLSKAEYNFYSDSMRVCATVEYPAGIGPRPQSLNSYSKNLLENEIRTLTSSVNLLKMHSEETISMSALGDIQKYL